MFYFTAPHRRRYGVTISQNPKTHLWYGHAVNEVGLVIADTANHKSNETAFRALRATARQLLTISSMPKKEKTNARTA